MHLSTPEQIQRFKLITLEKAVRLEILGMRHSSGVSATMRAKTLLNLPKHSRRITVLRSLEAKINELPI